MIFTIFGPLRGDIPAIYSVLREFALENEQYAIAQYQRNAQQSLNMQQRSRGKDLADFGFMNIEQRMSTPLPKFADAGQDIDDDEFWRPEDLFFRIRPARSTEFPSACNKAAIAAQACIFIVYWRS